MQEKLAIIKRMGLGEYLWMQMLQRRQDFHHSSLAVREDHGYGDDDDDNDSDLDGRNVESSGVSGWRQGGRRCQGGGRVGGREGPLDSCRIPICHHSRTAHINNWRPSAIQGFKLKSGVSKRDLVRVTWVSALLSVNMIAQEHHNLHIFAKGVYVYIYMSSCSQTVLQ